MTRRSLLQRYAAVGGLAAIPLLVIAALPAKTDGKPSTLHIVVAAAAMTVIGVAGLLITRSRRKSVLFRYFPLAGIAALLLLLMGVSPSRAPATQEELFQTGDVVSPAEQAAGGASPAEVAAAEGAAAGGAASTTGGRGRAAGAAAGAADISHCVAGRQFDPVIDYYAPPCRPKSPGINNGGATYQGVTATTIKIVDYSGKANEAVDAIAKAQDLYWTPAEQAAFDKAAETFINKAYQLWGRRVVIELFNGSCTTVPPDYTCLRNEVRQIVAERKPFFVKWNSSLASPFFDELSALKTPNAGGHNFSDSFSAARAPYHWDVQMSGTRIAHNVGQFYCGYLHGKNAVYAGAPGQSGPRVLGAISQNDEENAKSVAEFKEEIAKCGASLGPREFYYAQDISSAETQRRAAVAKMREPPEANIIACFCEYIAPNFLYATAEEQQYHPEHLVVGTAFMEADQAAQSYGKVIPPPSDNQFENAFGLSTLTDQEGYGKDVAARVWRAAGNSGSPPYKAAGADWEYYSMIAGLLQEAGPSLTPTSMAQGAFAMGLRGGTAQDWRQVGRTFGPGDFSWTEDMRVVYWSTTRPSTFNGENGTMVPVYQRRFMAGQYGRGDLVLPPKPR